MSDPPWACLRKKDLGWDRGVESKKVVQHVYLVGAKSIKDRIIFTGYIDYNDY